MGPLVSTIPDLHSLVGRRIRATREFSRVPTSTHGVIVGYRPTDHQLIDYDGHEAIVIAWMRTQDHLGDCPIWNDGQCPANTDYSIVPGKCHPLRDDFSRTDKHDETQWLELLEK